MVRLVTIPRNDVMEMLSTVESLSTGVKSIPVATSLSVAACNVSNAIITIDGSSAGDIQISSEQDELRTKSLFISHETGEINVSETLACLLGRYEKSKAEVECAELGIPVACMFADPLYGLNSFARTVMG